MSDSSNVTLDCTSLEVSGGFFILIFECYNSKLSWMKMCFVESASKISTFCIIISDHTTLIGNVTKHQHKCQHTKNRKLFFFF